MCRWKAAASDKEKNKGRYKAFTDPHEHETSASLAKIKTHGVNWDLLRMRHA